MRFLELMQIWRFSGPYIYVIVKMLRAMIPLLSLLFIPLVAFGTLREGIMVMNRTHVTVEGIKNILLEPYFMLYGEVYAPEIDRECYRLLTLFKYPSSRPLHFGGVGRHLTDTANLLFSN